MRRLDMHSLTRKVHMDVDSGESLLCIAKGSYYQNWDGFAETHGMHPFIASLLKSHRLLLISAR